MPTTVALVPLVHPDSGKQIAAGEEVTLGDEDYAALRADGKVAASAQEVKEHQVEATAQGIYNARTGRDEASGTKGDAVAKTDAPLPGPSAPKEKK